MISGHTIDGTLASWAEIRDLRDWDTLLIGNGLSMNVWPGFSYTSLHEQALIERDSGRLSEDDANLFEVIGQTTNFERVLAELGAAIRVAKAFGKDATAFDEHYQRIQNALAVAVRSAHVEARAVPARTLSEIRSTLLAHGHVFTTSYDLLTYWSMGYGNTFAGFCDYFWSNGRNEFDISKASAREGLTPVLFLHGALHLVVQDDGRTRKLRRGEAMLLEQVARPPRDDPHARPLLVTEGSSQDKLAVIEANEYLRFALEALRRRSDPLVVFGHSLSEQDRHLVDAVNLHPERPVAVSIFPESRARVRARQGEIRAVLDTHELYFYDSTTHPLGGRQLQARRAPAERAVA
jgi:hypothetical protein